MNKPRIYLKHAWSDNGWEYHQWACIGLISKTEVRQGLGATPEKAYDDWARQVNVERLETVA